MQVARIQNFGQNFPRYKSLERDTFETAVLWFAHSQFFIFKNTMLILYVSAWWVEAPMSWTLVVKVNRADKVVVPFVCFMEMFRNKIIKYLFYVLFQLLCKTNKSKLKENISVSDFKYQRTGNSSSLISHWDYSNLLF